MEVPDILKKLCSGVPIHLSGLDRIEHLLKALEEVSEDQRQSLRGLLNSFLAKMPGQDASDIDMGGTGCRERGRAGSQSRAGESNSL